MIIHLRRGSANRKANPFESRKRCQLHRTSRDTLKAGLAPEVARERKGHSSLALSG